MKRYVAMFVGALFVVATVGIYAASAGADHPRRSGFVAECLGGEHGRRAKVIEPACRYLEAFETRDASNIPLAQNVWRIENGHNTGSSPEAIRTSVESPALDVIEDVRDIRWFVDGNDAIAYYVLDLKPVAAPNQSVLLAERFRSDKHGLLTEIEVVFVFCTTSRAVNTDPPNGMDQCPRPPA